MTISIDLHCDACQGSSISIPIDGCDESPLDCEDCGADLGTLGDLKALVTLQVLGRKTTCDRPRYALLN